MAQPGVLERPLPGTSAREPASLPHGKRSGQTGCPPREEGPTRTPQLTVLTLARGWDLGHHALVEGVLAEAILAKACGGRKTERGWPRGWQESGARDPLNHRQKEKATWGK